MSSYLLLSGIFVFLFYRFLRSEKIQERLLLLSFFLLSLLILAVHPWIRRSYPWLELLEKFALFTSFFWLSSEPILGWIEKRKGRKSAFFLLRNGKGPLSEIVSACRSLAESKRGALMAIERKDSLKSWIQSGIPLDAWVRRETILSIFTPPGALHDGGVVILRERIAAAGVVFPLSKRLDLPTELGTRHRAALGLSEVTDAVAIVISEETGKISLAVGAKLLYDVKLERLAELLEMALRNRLIRRKKKPSAEAILEVGLLRR